MPDPLEAFTGAADIAMRGAQNTQAIAFNQLRIGDFIARNNTDAQLSPFNAAIKISQAEGARMELAQSQVELQDYLSLRPARQQLAHQMLALQSLTNGGNMVQAKMQLEALNRQRASQLSSQIKHGDLISDVAAGFGLSDPWYSGIDAPEEREAKASVAGEMTARATRYGYEGDEFYDSNSAGDNARGVPTGSRDNDLIEGQSVALSPDMYEKLGIDPKTGGSVEAFIDGQWQTFQADDVTAAWAKNRFDFFDPSGNRKSIDGSDLQIRRTPTATSGGGPETDLIPGGGTADESDMVLPAAPGAADLRPVASTPKQAKSKLEQFIEILKPWGGDAAIAAQVEGNRDFEKALNVVMATPEGRKKYFEAFPDKSPFAGVRAAVEVSTILTEPERAEYVDRIKKIEDRGYSPMVAATAAKQLETEFNERARDAFRPKYTGSGIDLSDKKFAYVKDSLTSVETSKRILDKLRSLPKGEQVGAINTFLDKWKNTLKLVGIRDWKPEDLRRTGVVAAFAGALNTALKLQGGVSISDQEAERFLLAFGDPSKDDPQKLLKKFEEFHQTNLNDYARLKSLLKLSNPGIVDQLPSFTEESGAAPSAGAAVTMDGSAAGPWVGVPNSDPRVKAGHYKINGDGRKVLVVK